jgi:putative lipoic acid-binding regulatory protein
LIDSNEWQRLIDLLNDTHDFPTQVMVKVIGINSLEFVGRVVASVRETLEQEQDPPFRTRHTPNGRHVAVTLEPFVVSAEQVLAIYARLRTVEGVIMML